MNEILDGLNPEQLEAVTSTEGFIRVIAGAGSGKTRALAHRFAYLVEGIGISPSNILCVTFTNKAANEMKNRIHKLIGDANAGYIGTFHSLCVVVLKEDINVIRYPKSFIVLDNEDSYSIFKTIYSERGLTLRDMTFREAKGMVETIKDDVSYVHDLIYLSVDELKRKYQTAVTVKDIIFRGYLYEQKKCFALDFDDLIHFTVHIFKISEETRLKWQKRLEYIMVDEFQDIDGQQYEFMSILCEYHRNLFVVGDPDQTIYTWRGANVDYILNFDKDMPPCKTITLDRNYRSSFNILAAANSLIEKNQNRIPKELKAEKSSDFNAPVLYNHSPRAEDDAFWIAGEILKLNGSGAEFKEIAILYRAHYLSRTVEEVFLKKEIPYTIHSGTSFYSRKEIKDVLSYLRILIYKDDISFSRIINEPKRNIGERRMEFLKKYAEENNCTLYTALNETLSDPIFQGTKAADFIFLIEKYSELANETSLSNLLTEILNESGYEDMLRTNGDQNRLDNLAELKQAMYDYETGCGEDFSLEDYFNKIALMTASDNENGANTVKLMTVHTAKGLEFKNVFIIGMSEGIFPSKMAKTTKEMEEERRLCYVALTRAEERLYLSDTEGINLDGSYRYPSRFIFNIDKEYITYITEPNEKIFSEAQFHIAQNERALSFESGEMLFKTGDIIKHPIMGLGEILEFNAETSCYIIKFENTATPRSINIKIKMEKN